MDNEKTRKAAFVALICAGEVLQDAPAGSMQARARDAVRASTEKARALVQERAALRKRLIEINAELAQAGSSALSVADLLWEESKTSAEVDAKVAARVERHAAEKRKPRA